MANISVVDGKRYGKPMANVSAERRRTADTWRTHGGHDAMCTPHVPPGLRGLSHRDKESA